MAVINGFRLILRDGATVSFISCPYGAIDYHPNLKYRVAKGNAFDPTLIHRREPWHEDTFDVSAVLDPDEYYSMLHLLQGAGQLYLEYTAYDAVTHQFPVEVASLPACPDDLHEYPAQIKFGLVSRYINPPGLINFEIVVSDDENEIVLSTT